MPQLRALDVQLEIAVEGCAGRDIGERELVADQKRPGRKDQAVDERVAARFLLSTIRGLRVSAKAGVEPKDLRAIATLALSTLKPR